MVRDVDLVSYLPPFMMIYKELAAAFEAENPEFHIVWESVDKALKNRFVSAADEYGLSRFEKMLGISPAEGDSLDVRRSRIQNRWNNQVPFTLRVLASRLAELLGGEHNFSLHPDFDSAYGLMVVVYSADDKLDREIRYLLESIVPANVVIDVVYESVTSSLSIYCGRTIEQADIIELRQR